MIRHLFPTLDPPIRLEKTPNAPDRAFVPAPLWIVRIEVLPQFQEEFLPTQKDCKYSHLILKTFYY